VIEVAPRQEFPYRAGQSVAVEIPQRPRLWRYFSPASAPQPSGPALAATVPTRPWLSGQTNRCGSPGMVRHTVQELRAVGFPASSIRREQFDFLQGTELDDTVEIPVVAEGT
jgi:NAD(P)H-flavin reductase